MNEAVSVILVLAVVLAGAATAIYLLTGSKISPVSPVAVRVTGYYAASGSYYINIKFAPTDGAPPTRICGMTVTYTDSTGAPRESTVTIPYTGSKATVSLPGGRASVPAYWVTQPRDDVITISFTSPPRSLEDVTLKLCSKTGEYTLSLKLPETPLEP